MTAYYNEHDAYAAQWLRNLIKAGLIADGEVDERSITEVAPEDVRKFAQCHFFAGIGGWSLAFRLWGWPDERPGWSGSAPCPPWSRARIWHRESEGKKDARDLWPELFRLIDACRPAEFFGEQVAGKKVQPWIDRAKENLAGAGYRFHGEDRKARDYGSPQGRERFYFSADLGGARGQGLVAWRGADAARPWRWRGEADLRAIAKNPFKPGDLWPQPLVRRGDAKISARVASVRAYGNAIDPWVAAQFIDDVMRARP